MTLKNMVEKKQLNFDQPLLSVRRGSLAGSSPDMNKNKTNNSKSQVPALPYYISDLKSGPITNPGVVPFQWEQTPGRPKDEKKDAMVNTEDLHRAPTLPPGRIINHNKKLTDNEQRCSPASSSRSHSENTVLCSLGSSFVDKVSSSDDENVIYNDARDTLSRTGSFFYNCSSSGASGLDGPNMDPSGPVVDPQARDFMMGRFLPAAKAVASETPQFAPRKHPTAREQPRPVIKVVSKRSSIDCNVSSTLPHNVHKELEAEEEDDDADDFDDAKDLPAKLCGLLPRFCLLNPIPGMRDQSHLISSVRTARIRPQYGGMRSKTVNKVSTMHYFLKTVTFSYNIIFWKMFFPSTKRSLSKNLTQIVFETVITFTTRPLCLQAFYKILCSVIVKAIESSHDHLQDRRYNKLGEVKRISYLHGSTNKSTQTTHFGHNGNSPWKIDSSLSFLRERGFCGLPGEAEDSKVATLDPKFKALLTDHNVKELMSPVNSTSEEILYINYKSKIDSHDSNSMQMVTSDGYLRQDMKLPLVPEQGTLAQTKKSNIVDAWLLSSSDNGSQNDWKDILQVSPKDPSVGLVLNTELSKKSHVEKANKKSGPSLALAPFLPKSPSESWLSRTLPSVSMKQPSSKLSPGNVTLNTSYLDNTRDGQHLFLPPTGELATISEN